MKVHLQKLAYRLDGDRDKAVVDLTIPQRNGKGWRITTPPVIGEWLIQKHRAKKMISSGTISRSLSTDTPKIHGETKGENGMKWIDNLSATQASILALMVDGLSFDEIADTLNYSHGTLARMLARIASIIEEDRAQ